MSDAPPTGHIKLARKMFDAECGDALWHEPREFSRWEAWVDMIQLACFAPYRHVTKYGAVDLERGEFVASLRWLGARWKWTVKRVRGFFSMCQKSGRIRAQREAQAGIVYLLVNYDTYQSQGHSEGTAKGIARAQRGHKREAVLQVQDQKLASSDDASANGESGQSGNWVSRLAAIWLAEVGTVNAGHIGAALKESVQKHGIERVERAMRAYIAVQNADLKPCKPTWFGQQSEMWIERTASPIDVIDGEMSPTLELLTRPARRNGR